MTIFQPSKEQRGWVNFGKTLLQTAGFWAFFLYLLPYLLITIEKNVGIPTINFPGQAWIGASQFLIFSTAAIASSYSMSTAGKGTPLPFDCAQKLVISGPYAYVRNPMAITGLGQAIAIGIYFGSVAVIMYAIAGGLIWNSTVRLAEEADLLQRFGEPYSDYCKAVKCWVPNITPYTGSQTD